MNAILAAIKNSLSEIRKNKFDYLFLFYNLVFFVGAVKQFETNEALIINFIVVFLITVFRNRFSIKGLVIVLLFFTLIIFLPTFSGGFNNIEIYVGSYIRILTAILIICYFRAKFFIYFENIIFVLALISLPLFLIQILDIKFFNLFKDISEVLLNDERLKNGLGALSGHRYFLVFLVNSWGENRNSGFTWEPAGFGAILCWAMLINLSIFKMKLNPKFIVLFFTALTTFSLGTYLTLIAIVFYFLINAKVKTGIIYLSGTIIFLLLIYSFSFFSEMSIFMTGKANDYIETVESGHSKNEKYVNRVQGVFAGYSAIIDNPLGSGLDPENKTGIIHSANGFINLIIKFGILGGSIILYLIFLNYNFIKRFYYQNLKGGVIFLFAVLLTLNGNPFANQPFFFAFLISGFLNIEYFKSYLRSNKLAHSVLAAKEPYQDTL